MDSSESAVHGQQEGSAYNGHFESVCYHPLFLFNDHDDCLAAKLRPGNVASPDDWEELLVPEIGFQQAAGRQAGGALDAALVSSGPGKRGPASAERAGVQPRECLAAAGSTSADRHLVADRSPAAPRQDGWAACQARPLLPAPAGGESPDAAAVRVDAPAHLGAAGADRLTGMHCRTP
jgi:hypothetical protein